MLNPQCIYFACHSTKVNGENVENKSHAETVNRIIELAKQPAADIKLLVVERVPTMISQFKPTPVAATVATTTVTEQNNNSPASSNKSKNTLKSSASTPLDSVLPTLAGVESINLQNVNVYPEIKVCEFLGYPTGTQLGVVVTSDDYSHDVIKVAEESPAHKAGLCKGDIIIAVNEQSVEGNPAAIELLNEFSESRPLKVVAASRYAYEWSKLLRIRITEKDWPNIKKYSTRYAPNSTTRLHTPTSLSGQQMNGSLYAPSNFVDPSSRNILMRNEVTTTDNYVDTATNLNTRYNSNESGSTRLAKTYANNYVKSPVE